MNGIGRESRRLPPPRTLLQWRQLELQQPAIARWNGVRPQLEGAGRGDGFLFNVPAGTPK